MPLIKDEFSARNNVAHTVRSFLGIFKCMPAEHGTSARRRQDEVFMHFMSYLREVFSELYRMLGITVEVLLIKLSQNLQIEIIAYPTYIILNAYTCSIYIYIFAINTCVQCFKLRLSFLYKPSCMYCITMCIHNMIDIT